MMAESGVLVRTSDGPRLLLVNGNRQQIDADGQRLQLLYFDRNSFDLSDLEEDKGPRWRKPRERYLQPWWTARSCRGILSSREP